MNNEDILINVCWICNKKLCNYDYMLLPFEDEYLGQDITIFKNSIIIKDCIPFKFLYYTCCNKCIEQYLKIYNNKYKLIKQRELNGKKIYF